MTQDQALLNAVAAQRDNAMNALAQANAQIAILNEQNAETAQQIAKAREQLAELQAKIDALPVTVEDPLPVVEG